VAPTALALGRMGVRLVPRTVDAVVQQCQFADGTTDAFDAAIWALGYCDEASWLQIPAAVDAQGRFMEERGTSPVAGLFYVGRSWQHTRASALFCGVGADAAAIVDRVRHYLGPYPPTCPSAATSPAQLHAQIGTVAT
jgi:putative flavoprotein involved in K+ transport